MQSFAPFPRENAMGSHCLNKSVLDICHSAPTFLAVTLSLLLFVVHRALLVSEL